MPKAGSASFTLLTLDGVNLLGAKVTGFSWALHALQEETTGLGDNWTEQTPTGLRRATVSQQGAYFDTQSNGLHSVMAAMPLAARTLTWSPDGATLFSAKGTITTGYDVLARNAALTKANVTYEVSGALDAGGAVVQPPQDQTATWTSATVDSGAASTLGGSAIQTVTAKAAGITGFVGALQHSTDGATGWAAIATFANVTAAPNQQSVVVAGTINRYLRFVGTVTGTGTIRVAAGLFRT